jgi:hypothetical protein
VVTVYNVNKGFNENIVKRSANLFGYVTLVSKVRENEQAGMERSRAVKKAIEECIKLGVLVEYLKSHASEVSNMCAPVRRLEYSWWESSMVRLSQPPLSSSLEPKW